MKVIRKIIESYGLTVTYTNKTNMWIKAQNTVIMCNLHQMFGLSEDNLMLYVKQKFYQVNIKIDLQNPENNKPIKPEKKKDKQKDKSKYIPINERKENIRKILRDKFKLLP